MKSLIIALALCPALSFASIYSCSGSGFALDLTGNPIEMKITGNGINTMAHNVRLSSTFDTVVVGNIATPAATIKLTIKDSSFGNPGDRFTSSLQISSAAGVKDFSDITCIRGNE